MPAAAVEREAGRAIGWRDRLAWTFLAVVPSGLLVSVTAHISTDIAAVPLLWVVPLALFLLTFVLVFSERTLLPRQAMVRVQVWTVGLAIVSFVMPFPLWTGIPLHLAAFFSSAMVCHDALYRRRPEVGDLTEFYLFMSLGGCIGGIFCALIAPQIFSTIFEYPLFLILGLFCRTDAFAALCTNSRTLLTGFVVCGGVTAAAWLLVASPALAGMAKLGLVAVFAVAAMVSWRVPARTIPALATAAVVASVLSFSAQGEENIRSFFGVHRLAVSADGRFRTLSHGTTIHGAVRLLDEAGQPRVGRPEPTTYYTPEGGIGQGIASIRDAHGGKLSSVVAVGLGTGSLACHIADAERWTFYEIDTAVVDIARDPAKFGFVTACAPDVPVVVGDARLTLAKAPGGNDLIVIDAFSSDSIPAHLMTAEAFALYRSKLAPHGAIVVHISNRNLDLGKILTQVAEKTDLVAYRLSESTTEPFEARYRSITHVMAFAADPADLGRLASEGAWKRIEPDPSRRVWTDDFSNVIEAMIDKYRS